MTKEPVNLEEKMIINRFSILLSKKKIQEKRNISLAEVEASTGIPRKTLYAWSLNRITRYDARVIDALCIYFKCQVGDLLMWQSPDPWESADNPYIPSDPDEEEEFFG